jgi:two-component system cell cycle response regulator
MGAPPAGPITLDTAGGRRRHPSDPEPLMPPTPPSQHPVTPLAVRWGLWLATALVALEAVRALFVPSVPVEVARWLFEPAIVLAAASCLIRAVRGPGERAAWGLLGTGLALWVAGGIYYRVAVASQHPQPIVSLADWLSIAVYPFAYAGVLLVVRSRIGGLRRSTSLDGVMAGLAATAVLAAVLLDGVVEAATATAGMAAFAKLAYPVGDLGLLGLLAGVALASGRLPGRAPALLVSGSAAFAASNLVWIDGVARGTFVPGTITDVGWYAGPVLMAWAAWSPRERIQAATSRWRHGVPPLLAGLTALAILAWDEVPGVDVNAVAIAAAVAALLTVTIRLALMFRENAAMLEASERLAHTDMLTGLANRRQLIFDLDAFLGVEGPRGVLALFDLNGFKSYNDTFGHLAGDELLARLGRRLEAAVGGRGTTYRMGGDEFCVLLADGETAGPSVLRTVGGTLSERGEGFAVTAAMGVVELPREATTPSEALRCADRRMYAHKRGDRASATAQTSEVLMRALSVRDSTLGLHAGRVAALARAVAEELGLSAAATRDVDLAAELHDIGKLAIPDEILTKPGPLTDDEWRFMHQHTAIGQHILEGASALARLAPVVRASHERVDGTGYPDGLAGDAIPLAARIILACDAYDAMTDSRPYSPAVSEAGAMAELRHCAGTQFDVRVVEALCRVVGAERPARARANAA